MTRRPQNLIRKRWILRSTMAYASIRQNSSAYVTAYVSIRQIVLALRIRDTINPAPPPPRFFSFDASSNSTMMRVWVGGWECWSHDLRN